MRKLVWASVIILLALAGIAGFWFLFGQKVVCTSATKDVQDAVKAIIGSVVATAQEDYDKSKQVLQVVYIKESNESTRETSLKVAGMALDLSETLLNDSNWLAKKADEAPQRGLELVVASSEIMAAKAASTYTATWYVKSVQAADNATLEKLREALGPEDFAYFKENAKRAGNITDIKVLSDMAYADSVRAFESFNQTRFEELLVPKVVGDIGETPVLKPLAFVCSAEIAKGAAGYVKEYLEYAKGKVEGYRAAGDYAKAYIYELTVGVLSLNGQRSMEDIEKEYPFFWERHYKYVAG